MMELKIYKAARMTDNAGIKKRKRAAAEESGRTNKGHRTKRLTHDDAGEAASEVEKLQAPAAERKI